MNYTLWANVFAIMLFFVTLGCNWLFDRNLELQGRVIDLSKQVEALKDDAHPWVLCPEKKYDQTQ